MTRGNLGTTPISSLPLVSSYASGLTFGETTFFINLLFVAAQWLLLRKSINKLLLLSQIPITFAFSYFIDTSMQITEFLSSDIYWKCFAVSMLGNVVLCNSFSWWTDRKCKLYCDVFGVFCTLRSPRIFCQLVHGKNVPCALVGLQPKANESAWPYLDWKLGIIWNWRCGNCKAD